MTVALIIKRLCSCTGNPFKINKNMIMDEVVLDEVSLVQNGQPVSPSGGMSPKINKRTPESIQPGPGGKRLKKGETLAEI